MAEEQITIDVNLITADSAKNLQELTEEIEALENAFKNADFGSAEFDRLGRQLAEKRGQVIQFDKELEQMQGPQFMAEKFVKMGEGIAGAFAAAQGAAAVFGKDNEKLEQSIVKVQGAVAIAVGARSIAESGFIQIIAKSNVAKRVSSALDSKALKTLRESTLATKAYALAQKAQAAAQRLVTLATQAFGKALIATGIGAIVVGIGTLVANWDKLNGTVSKAVEVFLKFNPVIGGIVKVFNTLKSAVLGVAEGLGLVADEQTKAAKKLAETADQQITDATKAADRVIAIEEAKGNDIAQLQRESLEKQLAIAKEAHLAMQATSKSFTEEELKEAEARYLDLDNALKVHNLNQQKLLEDAEEERKEKEQEAFEKRMEVFRQQAEAVAQMAKDFEEQSDVGPIFTNFLFETDRDKAIKRANELAKFNFDAEQEAEAMIANTFEEEEEEVDDSAVLEQVRKQLGPKHEKELQLIKEFNDTKANEQMTFDEFLEERRQDNLAKTQANLDIAGSMFGTLGGLADAFSKDQKKNKKIQRALAVAQIGIDTAKGLAGAVAAGAGQPFPANIAAIAMGVTTVLTNIAAAKKALTDADPEGGSAGSEIVAPSTVGGNAPTIPSLPTTTGGASGTEQTTEDVFGEGAMPRAFVVESDMTNAQEAAQKTNDLATL